MAELEFDEEPARRRPGRSYRQAGHGGSAFFTMLGGSLGCMAAALVAIIAVCGGLGFLIFKGSERAAERERELEATKEKETPKKAQFMGDLLSVGEVVEVIPEEDGETRLFDDSMVSLAWTEAIVKGDGTQIVAIAKSGKMVELPPKTKVQITKPSSTTAWVKVMGGMHDGRQGIIDASCLVPKKRVEKWMKEGKGGP